MLTGLSKTFALTATAVALAIPSAASTTPAWTLQRVPTPTGVGGQLSGVSCPTATMCMASNGLYYSMEKYSGGRWAREALPVPAGGGGENMFGVSCTSATRCMAVGLYVTGPNDSFRMVSLGWNGRRWKLEPRPTRGGSAALTGISCYSAADCTAVGFNSSQPGLFRTVAEHWNGRTWTIQATPNPPGGASTSAQLVSVSCPAARDCTAVGGSGSKVLAERWNGRNWAIQPAPTPSPEAALLSVSCVSPARCTAVGSVGGTGGYLTGAPLAERWNGRNWAIQRTPRIPNEGVGSLTGVSCVTAARCTAVGSYQVTSRRESLALAEVWNGRTWRTQETAQPSKRKSLLAVSCVTARTCTAVGWRIVGSGQQGSYYPLAEHK